MEQSEKTLVYPLTGARAQDSFYYVTGDRWCIEGEEKGKKVRIPGKGKPQEEWEALLHTYADRGFVLVWQKEGNR
ncbi:MAG: hypothetical protein ACI4OJ_01435 [Lachnospiraceae bacterium]